MTLIVQVKENPVEFTHDDDDSSLLNDDDDSLSFNNKHPILSSFDVFLNSDTFRFNFNVNSEKMERYIESKKLEIGFDNCRLPMNRRNSDYDSSITIDNNNIHIKLKIKISYNNYSDLELKYDNIKSLYTECKKKWDVMMSRIDKINEEIESQQNKRQKDKAMVFLVNINNEITIQNEEDMKKAYDRRKSHCKYNNDYPSQWFFNKFPDHKTFTKIGKKESFSLSIDDIKEKYPQMIKMMVKGDLVENIHESGYRSQGVYCFDGEDLVDQCRIYDDYGTPSSCFKLIKEFPPGYWDCPIEYNKFEFDHYSQFYWHHDQAYNEIDFSEFDYTIKETEKHKLVSFEYDDKKYLVFVNKDRDLENYPASWVGNADEYKKDCGESNFVDHDYYLREEF